MMFGWGSDMRMKVVRTFSIEILRSSWSDDLRMTVVHVGDDRRNNATGGSDLKP